MVIGYKVIPEELLAVLRTMSLDAVHEESTRTCRIGKAEIRDGRSQDQFTHTRGCGSWDQQELDSASRLSTTSTTFLAMSAFSFTDLRFPDLWKAKQELQAPASKGALVPLLPTRKTRLHPPPTSRAPKT
ncbi:hypothetical protein D6C81_06597 [Aureobasidium pullulans]|nr:hypothetical protein D6C81_06597 [Aureobasidium pullulans]